MTIQELMELRAKTWDEARNFLDSKRNDSGVLSEEDSKTYDEMENIQVAGILRIAVAFDSKQCRKRRGPALGICNRI